MASSASRMDWEPHIPGTWPSTPRFNRKRTASAAGLKEIPSEMSKEIPVVAAINHFPNTSMFEKVTSVVIAIAAITFKVFVAGGLMTYRAARSSVRGAVQYRQTVVEIRRFTNNGFESVKRRATGIVRPRDPTSQEIARARAQPGGQNLQRNRMDRTLRITESSTQADIHKGHTSLAMNATRGTSVHSKIFDHESAHEETYNIPSTYYENSNPTFTDQTTPQSRMHTKPRAKTQSVLDRHQDRDSSGHVGSLRSPLPEGTAAVAALRPNPIRGLDDPSVGYKQKSFDKRALFAINSGHHYTLLKNADGAEPNHMTRPMPEVESRISQMHSRPPTVSKFESYGTQSADLSRHMSKLGNRIPQLNSRTQRWKISTGASQRSRSTLDLNRPTEVLLPKIPGAALRHGPLHHQKSTYNQENTVAVQEAVDTSIEMMDAPIEMTEVLTVTADAPKAKQVRIALDSRNGLPRENVAKFFKASYCGDWEPSSPWDSERVGHTELDLNGHLNSLKETGSGSPVPPWTAVRKFGGRYPESIVPGQDPDFHTGPNKVFTPPSALSLQSRPSFDQVRRSPLNKCIATGPSGQNPDIKSVNKEIPLAKRPEIQHTPLDITSSNATLKISDSPATASSYYGMMERVVNGVKNAVFLSPSPARNMVQEEMRTSQRNSTLRILSLDPTSIIDLDAIHNVGETQYGVGGPSTENMQSEDDSKVEVTESLSSSSLGVTDKASGASLAGDVSRNEEKTSLDDAATENQEDPSTREADMFLETAMLEMAELDLSSKMTKKMKKAREAKEAALAKAKAEQEAKERAEKEAAEARAKAEEEEAQRKSHFQRRLPKQKLVQPLSHDWEARINEAMKQNGFLTTTSNGTDLTRHDLLSVLGDRKWLNDEIINGYIDWVVDYANKKTGKGTSITPRVVAQNSFFYDKLSKEGPSSVSRWMRRKKAAGAKLLEVETVLIPVNNASHWTLIVVSPKARTIEYLDSFGGAGVRMVDNTKKWLKVELGGLYNENEWQVLDTASASQDNGYDCGVFVATNAECVVGGISTSSYSGDDMTDQRRRIAGVLLNKGFGSGEEFIPAIDL